MACEGPTLFEPSDPEELLSRDGSAVLYRRALSEPDATDALNHLLADVPWGHHHVRVFGRDVAQPRLVAWFGDAGRSYTYSGLTLTPTAWTPMITRLKDVCEALAGSTFNSGLANLYRNGRDSVDWHADDEPELGPDPVIASLSLGAARRFYFRHNVSGETIKAVPPSGSVVVMSRGCQQHWRHQVPKMLRVEQPRINLTFRRIVR